MFRKHGRTVIRCPMLLKHKTLGVFEATTRDISATGMFILSDPDIGLDDHRGVAIGDEFLAEVESSGDDRAEPLQLKVARLADDGFALMFI